MSFMGNVAFGAGPGGGGRFAQTRGRVQGSSVQGVNYPSPFFDVAHTYLPTTVKQLFRWCRYYFLTNPLINATVFKLSEYPVTDIIIDHESSEVKKIWTEYFQDQLRYRGFQIECGLDYFTYGNAMIGMGFPFKKYLYCGHCRYSGLANKIRPHWVFTNYAFRLTCPHCGWVGDARAQDIYFRNASGIKTIRWNPEDVEINYNDLGGEYTYFYTIPAVVRNDVVIGRKEVVEGIPQVFIQALREQKGVIFSKDNFFHLRRPTLATQDRGWGIPLLLPVLKDTFYLQVMKKAQEAILLEHIVPLRVLFPQAGSGSADPYCVSPETLVETIRGLRPASEVNAGDYLRSHRGAWRRVQATRTRAVDREEKTYKVKVASLAGFPFVVSEGHPILAVPRACKKTPREGLVDPDFIAVKDLREGDYVAYPCRRTIRERSQIDLGDYIFSRAVTDSWVYRRLGQEAAEIYEWLEQNDDPTFVWGERRALLDQKGWSDSNFANAYSMRRECTIDRIPRYLEVGEDLATLVGFYLAEGCQKQSLVSFCFHIDEVSFARQIEDAVMRLGFRGVTHQERPGQKGRTVEVQDVLLSELLVNMCGSGFASKLIPDVIAEASDGVVLRMLKALFDGDGCYFETETKRLALKLSNPTLLLEARRLLLSFGFIGGTIKEVHGPDALSKADSYHLNYNGETADRVVSLLSGVNDRRPHPYQKSGLFRGDYVLLRIDGIEEVSGVDSVIGFQMAGDQSFCVAGVATHNTSINLVDWRDHVAQEIARWRFDQNYIPILPLPIGQETIGGDGKALLLTSEIQQWSEQIMVGMGVPREFLMGGMSYAGTNVSMRMLENAFIGYIIRQLGLIRFVMKQVAAYMDWPEVKLRFKPFKMADDIQRKAYEFQLNQAGKLSDTTLLASSDYAQEEENRIMIRETATRLEATKTQQIATATIQGEASLIMAKYQVKSQQEAQKAQMAPIAPGEPGDQQGAGAQPPQPGQEGQPMPPELQVMAPGGEAIQAKPPQGGAAPTSFLQNIGSQLSGMQRMPTNDQGQVTQLNADLPTLAMAQARQIIQMPPEQQQQAIDNLAAQSPELAQLVTQMLAKLGGGPSGGPQVDMRPLPEQRSPRREAGIV